SELIIRAFETALIVVVLLTSDVDTKLESLIAPYPVYSVFESERIFGQLPGSRASGADTHNGARIAKAAGTKIEKAYLRNAVVREPRGLQRIERKTGEIETRFIHQH